MWRHFGIAWYECSLGLGTIFCYATYDFICVIKFVWLQFIVHVKNGVKSKSSVWIFEPPCDGTCFSPTVFPRLCYGHIRFWPALIQFARIRLTGLFNYYRYCTTCRHGFAVPCVSGQQIKIYQLRLHDYMNELLTYQLTIFIRTFLPSRYVSIVLLSFMRNHSITGRYINQNSALATGLV